MAVVVSNISPFLEFSASPPRVPELRTRLLPSDAVLSIFKKDIHLIATHLESVFYHKERHLTKRTPNQSRVNGVEYENSSDDENGNGNGLDEDLGEDDGFDWEKEMRKRVKEIEEMKELEKKAEELQNKVDEEYGDRNGGQETEEEKRMRVKIELEKVAREQAERRQTAQLMFQLGQKAYEKGMYGRAIEFLEGALTIIPRSTLFGGELEKTHPSVSIRRQAANLRYILQAPKLKITQEEMVTIPIIGSTYDSYAATWSDKYKDQDRKVSGSTTNQLASTKDYLADFLVWKPPTGLEKNRAFWVSLALWIGLVGAALFLKS